MTFEFTFLYIRTTSISVTFLYNSFFQNSF
nr:MAG TPA: hypothetical protein [Caudoviricetes sp.]